MRITAVLQVQPMGELPGKGIKHEEVFRRIYGQGLILYS